MKFWDNPCVNRRLTCAAAATALLAIAGCGTAAAEDPADVYLDVVHDTVEVPGVADSDLVTLGENICALLDAGGTDLDVIKAGVDSGLTGEEVGSISGAAKAALCPEHVDG